MPILLLFMVSEISSLSSSLVSSTQPGQGFKGSKFPRPGSISTGMNQQMNGIPNVNRVLAQTGSRFWLLHHFQFSVCLTWH